MCLNVYFHFLHLKLKICIQRGCSNQGLMTRHDVGKKNLDLYNGQPQKDNLLDSYKKKVFVLAVTNTEAWLCVFPGFSNFWIK